MIVIQIPDSTRFQSGDDKPPATINSQFHQTSNIPYKKSF